MQSADGTALQKHKSASSLSHASPTHPHSQEVLPEKHQEHTGTSHLGRAFVYTCLYGKAFIANTQQARTLVPFSHSTNLQSVCGRAYHKW